MVHQQKPRLEPRLVFVVVMLAVPALIFALQTLLVRPGDACTGGQTGGLGQLFLPGVGCEQPVVPRTPGG